MKLINRIITYFVGGLFVFSGLIKINDPVGTAIKLEEYFEVFSGDIAPFFHVFVPYALPLAVLVCTLEVILGVALLANFRRKDTLWSLLALIVFFTFLTFYSAYFNKVTDCGCFGDAIKLTPWGSFTKDIILLVLIVLMFVLGKEQNINKQSKASLYTVVISTVFSCFVAYWAVAHLPFIDFRAYKVGVNIAKELQPEEPADIEYIFEKDGKEVRSKQYLMPETGHKYIDFEVKNPEKSQPKIKDYNVSDPEGNDVTQETLTGVKLFVIFHHLAKADLESIAPIVALAKALPPTIQTIAITSDGSNFEEFRHQNQLAIPYYVADGTMLKTAMRANPGLMLVKDGTVLAKWHHNDTPTADEVTKLIQN
jgi:uncharacterized membrane protein YphA (DoxX/SURF4 family)